MRNGEFNLSYLKAYKYSGTFYAVLESPLYHVVVVVSHSLIPCKSSLLSSLTVAFGFLAVLIPFSLPPFHTLHLASGPCLPLLPCTQQAPVSLAGATSAGAAHQATGAGQAAGTGA